MNFKMIREARNRNNVSGIVALHSSIFAKHKIKEMYWNMLMKVGNAINKRKLQCCVDELRHRLQSSVLKVI